MLASLHVSTDFRSPGVLDMCVDSGDRIYAATELGIQCVRSYGLVDVILLNPERSAAVRSLHLEEGGKLYALSSDTAYVRHLSNKSPANPSTASAHAGQRLRSIHRTKRPLKTRFLIPFLSLSFLIFPELCLPKIALLLYRIPAWGAIPFLHFLPGKGPAPGRWGKSTQMGSIPGRKSSLFF